MMLKYPGLLWLLLILVPLIVWYIMRQRESRPYMNVSSTRAFDNIKSSWKVWLMHGCFVLKLVAISAIIVALARPQTFDSFAKSHIEGTDIVLALDISGSMNATDIRPTRFRAARDVATEFVKERENDNMGLVVFSGESLSLMPLTTERGSLINAIRQYVPGSLIDGTAIGDGIASAINRLEPGLAKSKSIILLTDGTNNAGDVAPSTAAEIAKQKGIRIYTIGVGTDGSITIPDPYGYSSTTMETKIDEESLRSIANLTGGKYFRATDKKMLENVFKEIDKLEKTKLDVERSTTAEENFMPWVLIALCALALDMLIRYTVLRRIP